MGKKGRQRRLKAEYPGGWRDVLKKHPLTGSGFALHTGKRSNDAQVRRERAVAHGRPPEVVLPKPA